MPDRAAASHVTANTGTLAGGDELNHRRLIRAKALDGYINTDIGKLQAFFLA